MNQIIEKLEKRIEEVLDKRMSAVVPIQEFLTWKDERTEEINERPPIEAGRKMNIGDVWSSSAGYLWLECSVKVPKARNNEKVVGYFDFNSIHEGYASGFEAMLYINGRPFQGVDENHSIVILDAFVGQQVTLLFKLWSGITGGPQYPIYHQIKQAFLGYLYTETEEFGILSQMVLQQAKVLQEGQGGKTILLEALEQSFLQINWISQKDDIWRVSIHRAMELLQTALQKYPEREQFQIHCVGHTHIDLAWMWRVAHTKEKAMRSFQTAIRLFEEFEDFKFYQSTPQLYQYIKEESPRLYEEIKKYVKEGKWEAGGGMWVEADCNLPGGESLVRQILYGKKFFFEEFGVNTDFLWLPDAFGFPFCLPQLMKKSGMNTFMTSKLSWNKQNRFPHDTFRWRGMDGSEVMAYFLTTPAYGFPEQEWAVTYNGDISPKVLRGAYELYQEKQWNQEIMMTYGHGDGGGGCTREMIQKISAMKQVPFAPEVNYSHADQFFHSLEKRLGSMKPLPVWEDELYLEYHRGTFTSQAEVKRENRKLEYRFRNLEYLQVYDAVAGKKPMEDLENLENYWKILLKNQFHDILPGSSVHLVYEDVRKDFARLNEDLERLEEELWGDSKEEDCYTILNTGNWKRDCLVELPMCREGYRWTLEDKTPLKTAETKDGKQLVQIRELQPLGRYFICQSPNNLFQDSGREDFTDKLAEINLDKGQLETERYLLLWNDKGALIRLYDKILDFEVFKETQGNQLVVYEDKPLMFDAWDIDAYYKEKPYFMELVNVQEIENTALRTIIKFTYEFGSSVLEQSMILSKDEEQIEFVNQVDWQEKQCLLKCYFPVNVLAREAVFDTQFGNIKRSTTQNTSIEEAKFEVCGHRFVDVSQRDRGVAVLNDCKYGHEVRGNTIGLTLIKSAVDPDEHADRGMHRFTYSICPHKDAWYESHIQEKAFALNSPLFIHKGDCFVGAHPLFEIKGEFIELDAVKRAEDGNGLVVRFHEYVGGDCAVSITSPYGIVKFQECDLLERGISEWILEQELKTLVKPYEIKTYRILV